MLLLDYQLVSRYLGLVKRRLYICLSRSFYFILLSSPDELEHRFLSILAKGLIYRWQYGHHVYQLRHQL